MVVKAVIVIFGVPFLTFLAAMAWVIHGHIAAS